jgi:hypothetical protein
VAVADPIHVGQGKGGVVRDVVAVVAAWHEAVNRGDADALAALSHGDISIAGPRGTASGCEMLRDWLARSGIRLAPRRWFAKGECLVVAQIATWRLPDGSVTEPLAVASTFLVEEGRVRRTARYESLEEALAATGLTRASEWSPGGDSTRDGEG